MLSPPVPTKENVAYTRYADEVEDKNFRTTFQFPRGKPYTIANNAQLFKVQRWSTGADRWAPVRHQKSFIADKFFPPFALKEGNMKALLVES